jgi:hypothetical protein
MKISDILLDYESTQTGAIFGDLEAVRLSQK